MDQTNLHQYQKDIANAIVANKSLFVIAEMGLGKTAPTIFAINYLQHELYLKSALIIAPLRVMYNSWPNELAKWEEFEDISYYIIHGKYKVPYDILPKASLYLSNFESLEYIHKERLHRNCDILVIDESTFVKNHATKRFKTLKKMVCAFKHIILLTGTLTPSGQLTELFSQTFILDQGVRFTQSYHKFLNKYYIHNPWGYSTWDIKPDSKQKMLSKLSDITLIVQDKDKIKLPPKIINNVVVTLPEKAKKKYEDIEKEFFLEVEEGEDITVANAAVLSSKLRQICAGAIYDNEGNYILFHDEKIKALKEIVDTSESNILCAYQFRFERKMLALAFPNARFIDGSTSAKQSDEIITAWNKKEIKLMCCHPATISHGMNLQDGGHTLVWLSPDWSLDRTQQMNARLYRQGQTKTVFIHTIICDNTVDELVVQSLGKKENGQTAFLRKLKENQPMRMLSDD